MRKCRVLYAPRTRICSPFATAAIRMHLPGEIFAKGKCSQVPLLLLQLEGVEPVYVWFYGGWNNQKASDFHKGTVAQDEFINIFVLDFPRRVKISFIWVCSEGTFSAFLL